MACFLLRGPDGERWVEEQSAYRLFPGESIVPGAIKWECGPNQEPEVDWSKYKWRKCSNCGQLGVYQYR